MQKKSESRVNGNTSYAQQLAEIKYYTPPVLRETKNGWYVEFYAFDPSIGKPGRKRVKINRIKSVSERRKYAKSLMRRISERLAVGWNPFVNNVGSEDYLTFEEICDKYSLDIEKKFSQGIYREETYVGYKSYLKMMRNFAHKKPIFYAYQFDRKFCQAFLDHIFVDKGNSAQTHNNYLNFLRVFAGYCLQRSFIVSRVTDGLKPIPKRLYSKFRTVIPSDSVRQMREYLLINDRHFLLSCYLLYYCLIRPVEQTRLKISDVNIQNSTITLRSEASKNHKTQIVTLPKHVLFYMHDLHIFDAPSSDYLFSANLKPGNMPTTTKILRDHWAKMARSLKFDKTWKYYSLKDTGITEMLQQNTTTIAVRDQARHSSLHITELYAAHLKQANPELIDYRGAL